MAKKKQSRGVDLIFVSSLLLIYIFQYLVIYGLFFFLRFITSLESIPDVIKYVNSLWYVVIIIGFVGNILVTILATQ